MNGFEKALGLVPAVILTCGIAGAQAATALPDPKLDAPLAAREAGLEPSASLVLAGGCFWGIQAVFQHVRGVQNAVAGYAGGDAASASYDQVSSGATRHAEAVKITYDPSKITPGALLKIFFAVAHDPTQLNRQGPDYGAQYRSAIFYADDKQREIAAAYIAQLQAGEYFSKPIATTLEPLDKFYAAEAYHQDYVKTHPHSPYVVTHDLPKLDLLQKEFTDIYAR